MRADAANVAEFAVNEEANRELGFTVRVSHPTFGEYWRHGPIVTLDSAPSTIRAACEPGEHTRQILAELGYTPAGIERFKDTGIVGWPEGSGGDASARASEERERSRVPQPHGHRASRAGVTLPHGRVLPAPAPAPPRSSTGLRVDGRSGKMPTARLRTGISSIGLFPA